MITERETAETTYAVRAAIDDQGTYNVEVDVDLSDLTDQVEYWRAHGYPDAYAATITHTITIERMP